MPNEPRVRFAPSPTGYLHIGGLRTALYNYLYARHYGGKYFLRIEDTDQKRLVEGGIENILRSLDWAGLRPDEGVVLDEAGKVSEQGECGPYIQSSRVEIYRKYAHELVEQSKAYYCFCTPQRLESLRAAQEAAKLAPAYDKLCLKTVQLEEAKSRIEKGDEYVIRFDVPETGETKFEDVVRGEVSFLNKNLDDFVILKSDGYPTYHLAHVIDDHLMETSVVFRGEEWLPSTPKHILLFEAFGWEVPQYAHLNVILNKNTKRKLSKRDGDVSVEDFKKKGYLPEAVVNYIALLGWNPKNERELFSLAELVGEFEVEKLNRSGAIFDVEKLDWMNSHYIREKQISELVQLCESYLEEYLGSLGGSAVAPDLRNPKYYEKIVSVEKERMKKLSDVVENVDFYFTDPDYERELLKWKDADAEQTLFALNKARDELSAIDPGDWTLEKLTEKMLAAADPKNRGALLWPVRVALTGLPKSPSPFEIAWVIGKERTLQRINKALEI